MARRALVGLVGALAGCGSPPVTVGGRPGQAFGVRYQGNVLYAPVRVNDAAAGLLLLDTGAPIAVLGPSRWPGSGLGAGVIRIGALEVGGLRFGNLPALGLELFTERPGPVPGGLLGGEALTRFALTLDPRGPTALLDGAPPAEGAIPGIALPGVRVPMRLEGGGVGQQGGVSYPFGATRVVVTATVDGAARTLVVDSGASFVVLREALFDALVADGRSVLAGVPIQSARGVVLGRLARARSIQVGSERVAGAPVLAAGDALLDGFATEVGHPVDGQLGGTFLRAFAATVDHPGGALWLARYPDAPHVDPDELHAVGIALGPAAADPGRRLAVAGLYRGTAAAASGITVGEVLLSVDGAPTDALEAQEIEAMLRGPVGTIRKLVTDRASYAIRVDDLLPML